jgi:hypothetical protein
MTTKKRVWKAVFSAADKTKDIPKSFETKKTFLEGIFGSFWALSSKGQSSKSLGI